MAQGRKHKPDALRVLDGDKNKDRYNPNEPKPDVGSVMEPPDWLPQDSEARRLWFRLSAPLRKLGLLTELDWVAFETLCVVYGYWVDDPDPKWALRLQSLLAEFGCTPSSRSRITGATNKQDADPMERLLAGGR